MSKQSPKVNPEKVSNFAEALRQIFKEDKIDPDILRYEQMPSGYYDRIEPLLSKSVKWPKQIKSFYYDHKQAIDDLLFYGDTKAEESEAEALPIAGIEQLIDARIDLKLAEIKQSLLGQDYGIELCPARQQVHIKGKRGRTENRKAIDIASSLDEELYILFQRDKQKLGISESMLLDTILWHFYKKPKLSYELDPLRQDPPKVKK